MSNKTILGFGINDADYPVKTTIELPRVNGKRRRKKIYLCPYYQRWHCMLNRCYSKAYKNKDYWYLECSVSNEWKYFSKFKAWMEKQDWEGKELDKDILKYGNKVYGPETCAFVSHYTNTFFSEKSGSGQGLLQGVTRDKEGIKYFARCSDFYGNRIDLGRFFCEKEAHLRWAIFKRDVGRRLSEIQTDPRVSTAIIKRCDELVNKAEEMLNESNKTKVKTIWNPSVDESCVYIKSIRKNVLKITQDEAAGHLAGCAQVMYSRYELGKTPTPRSLLLLFKILENFPDLYKAIESGDLGIKYEQQS